MLHFFLKYLLTQQRYFVLARGEQFYNIVKKTRVLIIASLTLKETIYVALIGPIFQNTIETCLNSFEHCSYE